MQQFLLVDGYNIIFNWEKLKKIAQDDLEYARDFLVQILADYQGYTNQYLIIVFDAYNVKGNLGNITSYNNYVDIIYTKEAETADQYIEKTARVIGRKYAVRVATSDALEQVIILAGGATRVSARELLEEVEGYKKKSSKYMNTSKAIKINPMEDWMGEEVLKKMEKLRRGMAD